MMFHDGKPSGFLWVGAFCASALVHVGAVVLMLGPLGSMTSFDLDPQKEPQITITSVVLESDTAAPVNEPPVEAAPQTPVEPELVTENPTSDPITPLTDLAAQPGIEPDLTDIPDLITQTLTTSPTATTAPNPPAAPKPTVNGTINEMTARIKEHQTDNCLLAIPQKDADETPKLTLIADDEQVVRGFANTILNGLAMQPSQQSVLIDARQCSALNFARQGTAYPAFRLKMSLDETTIDSGTMLTGSIQKMPGRYISLLLIDDNGVVQDVSDYLIFTSDATRFEITLSRPADTRNTSQLLIALATAVRPATLNTQNGQTASDYFQALGAELDATTPMAIAPFDLR